MPRLVPPALAALFFLSGCAGSETVVGGAVVDPLMALRGKIWIVEDIDRGGIIDMSRVTIEIDGANRAAGRASCNRWFAAVAATEAGIAFGQAGTSRMACAEALMNQEQRFLATLARVRSFGIDATGALLLSGEDGAYLKAYPES